jgi:hypothetical protein
MLNQSELKFEPIHIRFDGLDAQEHKIDLAQFGRSAVGISKIMTTIAQFTCTGNYKKSQRKLDFYVLIGSAEDNCITFETVIKALENKDIGVALLACSGMIAGNLITDIYRLIFQLLWKLFSRSTEHKEIEAQLRAKLSSQYEVEKTDKLIDVIHKMAEGLLPAAKQAVQPINISCETIQFGDTNKNYFVSLDGNDKQAILDQDFELTALEDYRVNISELDWRNATCLISLQNDLKKRFKAVITDPQVKKPNNPYGAAANSMGIVIIVAKKKLYNGVLKEFIISDIKQTT